MLNAPDTRTALALGKERGLYLVPVQVPVKATTVFDAHGQVLKTSDFLHGLMLDERTVDVNEKLAQPRGGVDLARGAANTKSNPTACAHLREMTTPESTPTNRRNVLHGTRTNE